MRLTIWNFEYLVVSHYNQDVAHAMISYICLDVCMIKEEYQYFIRLIVFNTHTGAN